MKPHQERFVNEYRELKEKRDKLHAMNVKYEAGQLDFVPDCPLDLLKEQEEIMNQYLGILEARALFENVSVKFTEGNCYGIIGANGAGKSTFLKILAGEIEPNKGEVIIEPHKRLSVLKQDHFAYDENKVVETVIMGNKRLYEIMQEKERLYAKEDFNDENQKELANYFKELDEKNAKLMLSNSNPKNTNKEDNFFEEIYKGFNINEISAKRMINANAKGRGEISELLITNYEEQSKWESQKNSTMKMIALA
jgi:ABC-type glutathione transport system ATPase component